MPVLNFCPLPIPHQAPTSLNLLSPLANSKSGLAPLPLPMAGCPLLPLPVSAAQRLSCCCRSLWWGHLLSMSCSSPLPIPPVSPHQLAQGLSSVYWDQVQVPGCPEAALTSQLHPHSLGTLCRPPACLGLNSASLPSSCADQSIPAPLEAFHQCFQLPGIVGSPNSLPD